MVSAGADGMVRFWNIHLGVMMYEKNCTNGFGEGIFAMVSNNANTLLYTGDSLGWVSIYNIKDTALSVDEGAAMNMNLVNSFRAHISPISSMDIVEASELVITCAADCTIRCFTVKGCLKF